MVREKDFDIPFSGLKLGMHKFDFDIVESFFELFENSEVKKATLKVAIKLNKKATLLDLEFNISGNVELSCDTCADLYLQDLNEQFNLIVKFSELKIDLTFVKLISLKISLSIEDSGLRK